LCRLKPEESEAVKMVRVIICPFFRDFMHQRQFYGETVGLVALLVERHTADVTGQHNMKLVYRVWTTPTYKTQ